MAFVIKETETFEWDVEFTTPEKGKHVKRKFKAEFEILNEDEIREYFGEKVDRPASDFLLRSVQSITDIDVMGSDGKLAEGDDAIKILAKKPSVALAMVRAYFSGVTGHKSKN